MSLSLIDWHTRFTQQARWTQDLRNYLYNRAKLHEARQILDVGCGTGVLTAELTAQSQASVHGLDINADHLKMAMRSSPEGLFTLGDGHRLPYPTNSFDLSLCHFLLLWVYDPNEVVREMVRVTRPGGAVLALAEPDYGGRIDYPVELAQIGKWQQDALRHQGADPILGRKLSGIFSKARLASVETGVLGGQWMTPASHQERDSEWTMIQSDLEQLPNHPKISERVLYELRMIENSAWERGERVLFVPTFYAWGRVAE